jgi:CelD/BcsL family acetyltransferase involved in cellulose biosynthesis
MTIPAMLRETQVFGAPDYGLGDQHSAPKAGAVNLRGPGAEDHFRVELATQRSQDQEFNARWRELVAASKSPERIFQTPAFFRVMLDTRTAGTRVELLAIVRQSDNEIEGVVPVMLMEQTLSFAIGKLVLFAPKVPMVRLLGSIPAASSEIGVVECLAHKILALFPEAKSISMQAMPVDSDYWRTLAKIGARQRGLSTALLGDWRSCHTMPLPASFEQYVGQFSAKKRYNLNRQIRRLEQQAGALELLRIEHTDRVDTLLHSLAELVSPAEFAANVHPRTLAHLATQGLLCCYVLRAGGESLAVIMATRAAGVVHVAKIFDAGSHRALSIGTSAMHLAVEDIIGQGGIGLIDFGYGTPKHESSSSQVIETRGQILLFKCTNNVRRLYSAHAVFYRTSEALIATVKLVRKKVTAIWRERGIAGLISR